MLAFSPGFRVPLPTQREDSVGFEKENVHTIQTLILREDGSQRWRICPTILGSVNWKLFQINWPLFLHLSVASSSRGKSRYR